MISSLGFPQDVAYSLISGKAILNRLRHCFCGFMVLFLPLVLTVAPSSDQPAVDGRCLSCHRDPSLQQSTSGGRLRSVYVDPQEWRNDIHHQKGLVCVDCHVDANPSAHPVEGLNRPDCEACHAEACEDLSRSIHARVQGTEPLPSCHDCHTKHAIRKKDDPRSSLAADSLVAVCSPCHASQVTGMSWLDALVLFRVNGHRKENISEPYDRSRCLDCHFQEAAHGQPGTRSERCASCHGHRSGKGTLVLSSIHTAAILGGSGLTGFKILFLTLGVAAVGALAYRKIHRTRPDDAKEPSI